MGYPTHTAIYIAIYISTMSTSGGAMVRKVD